MAMERVAAHIPVLRDAVVERLAPADRRILLDCTVGLGGHADALLGAAGPGTQLIGIDLDESNLRRAKERLSRFAPRVRLFQANFVSAREVLDQADVEEADAVLADLGSASSQLDDPQRGFGFAAEGPLDMRMDRRAKTTAADLVNRLREAELADLIYRHGEERYSRRIAAAIVHARREDPIRTTGALAGIVEGAIPASARRARRGVHPATRTFQALRIAVNEELGSLDGLLELLPSILSVGGRAAIISFHSLEDRRVKRAFASWGAQGSARILTKKPITAEAHELRRNPRSRSAKLRAIERTA